MSLLTKCCSLNTIALLLISLVEILFMWVFQFRFSLIKMPKYLTYGGAWIMDRELVSIVLFFLQMMKLNDHPYFQLVISSKLQNQSILKSFYLWEQNSLKVLQVQSQTTSLWYFLFSQIILSNCSQKYHEEPCKFQLRVSGYFDGEYRKICPWQVIDQKLRRRHHKQF